MLAVQMARDPQIRQIVRDLYQLNSCLTVKPTQRGLKEIDESHLCFKFKYLTQKPCYTLKEDEFLKLIIAEQDQLLTIKFETFKYTAVRNSSLQAGGIRKENLR